MAVSEVRGRWQLLTHSPKVLEVRRDAATVSPVLVGGTLPTARVLTHPRRKQARQQPWPVWGPWLGQPTLLTALPEVWWSLIHNGFSQASPSPYLVPLPGKMLSELPLWAFSERPERPCAPWEGVGFWHPLPAALPAGPQGPLSLGRCHLQPMGLPRTSGPWVPGRRQHVGVGPEQ